MNIAKLKNCHAINLKMTVLSFTLMSSAGYIDSLIFSFSADLHLAKGKGNSIVGFEVLCRYLDDASWETKLCQKSLATSSFSRWSLISCPVVVCDTIFFAMTCSDPRNRTSHSAFLLIPFLILRSSIALSRLIDVALWPSRNSVDWCSRSFIDWVLSETNETNVVDAIKKYLKPLIIIQSCQPIVTNNQLLPTTKLPNQAKVWTTSNVFALPPNIAVSTQLEIEPKLIGGSVLVSDFSPQWLELQLHWHIHWLTTSSFTAYSLFQM